MTAKDSGLGGKQGAACAGLGRGTEKRTVGGVGEDRLLRVDEGAAMLAISVRAFYRLIADGQLPRPVKIGRATRMPLSDLERYIDALKINR